MYVLAVLWALLHAGGGSSVAAVSGVTPAIAADDALPSCTAPETRAAVKAAVQNPLVLRGLSKELEILQSVSELDDAPADRAQALEDSMRQQSPSLRDLRMKTCEVDDPQLADPVFVTVFVAGPGIPQPSGYVLNFGIPGVWALIGTPPL